ncbi:MAG: hypothetical protein M3301_02830, partial [Chloroflexota bacterium]|nr:hypothetical protein [Chloroflexota bacterium]
MRRTWPFEGMPEGNVAPRPADDPAAFAAAAGEGTEAVIIRIGLHDAQLVAIAPDGAWDRWVYHSVDEAKAVAQRLGIPVHVGEYPEPLRVRMNAYQRPASDFDKRAYPEQGSVGPVIPYPENRPRR